MDDKGLSWDSLRWGEMNGLVFKNEAAIREMFFIGELIFECELNESFSRKESNSKELFTEEGENGFV